MADGDDDLDTRVLVLAPTARDAVVTCDILAAAGITSDVCPTLAHVCREAARGVGTVVLTAEAVLADKGQQLPTLLRAQPPWSDLPLIVLTPPGVESPKLLRDLEAVGSMTLMKRPVQVSTIVSTVRAALRDRRRQYEVREHLVERARSESALRASEERLRLALTAARMGVWTLDVGTGTQLRDANLNVLLGLDAAETTQPFDEFLTHIHPDDRPVVRAAFAASTREGRPLRVEFRVVRPDGAVRWLRDQGDVFGVAGRAGHMAGACVDVTERREAEEELQRTNDELAARVRELGLARRAALNLMEDAVQARDALRASEERLRLILTSTTDFAILTLSPDRTVTTWSPGAAAIFGYAAAEMVGRSGDVVFVPEDRAAGAPSQEAETARRDGRAEDERWHLRKDGTRFWASGVMRPLRDGGEFVKVLRDLTDRKRMEDELRDSRDELEMRVAERTVDLGRALDSLAVEMDRRRDLTRQLGTAQEDERRRVARDLHDTVGQLIAGLSMGFKAIESSGHLPPPAAARLAETQRIMSELGRELHGLAVRLRPTSLDDIGLESALGQLVSEWSSRSGVKADFHAAGLGQARLPAEVETTVYRVVQEALTNVAKHANATQVSVAVTRPNGFVSVVVEDDGTGFDPDAPPKGRLGLLGMRERVEMVGGEINVESSPGAGTTVAVQIPIPTGGGS